MNNQDNVQRGCPFDEDIKQDCSNTPKDDIIKDLKEDINNLTDENEELIIANQHYKGRIIELLGQLNDSGNSSATNNPVVRFTSMEANTSNEDIQHIKDLINYNHKTEQYSIETLQKDMQHIKSKLDSHFTRIITSEKKIDDIQHIKSEIYSINKTIEYMSKKNATQENDIIHIDRQLSNAHPIHYCNLETHNRLRNQT